jgi:acetyl esterase/lipase
MLRRTFVRSALTAASALFAGCSPLGFVNALVPSDSYTRTRGVAYGSHEREKLDVYVPSERAATAPIAVFFYGGNWASGSRDDYVFAGEALASRGITAVIPDYRLYPEVRFPDFLYDCADAVRWTLDHAAEYGADPQRVLLVGHSAGAYNAAMLALNPAYLQRAGVNPERIRGLVGLAGPYDFLPLTGKVTKEVFGFPDTPRTTQPIEFASAKAPPALLATGDDDHVVDPGNSTRLAARLRGFGVSVREIVYPDVGHAKLVGALAAPLRGIAPVLDDVAGFIDSIPAPAKA